MKRAKTTRDRHANGGQGMNWIRKEKRLAIYMRDGLACAWCGADVEDAKLTLDHVVCHASGGGNDARNLVTACHRCNSLRQARSAASFARDVARYLNHGATAARILAHVRQCCARPLDVEEAKVLMQRRGGFVQALKGGKR